MIGGTYLWIVVAYSLTLLTDSISRVGRDSKKLVLVAVSSAILVYTSLQPNSITTFLLINGGYGWDWNGDFKISFMFLSIVLMLLLTYYCLKIFLAAPQNIKKYAFILLIGSVFISIVPVILFITNLVMIYFGIEGVMVSIGAVICTYAFLKAPQLIFLLPFRVHTLTIIDIRSGIPLYNYNWPSGNEIVDDMLFSGMISGISSILKEAVNQGDVQQIKMDKGDLILKYDNKFSIAFVLLTSHPSEVLTEALKHLQQEFIELYADKLQDTYDISNFFSASTLIEKHFAFIPKYDL